MLPHSAVCDIGRHPIRLSAGAAAVVLEHVDSSRPDLAAAQLAETLADYLAGAKVIAQITDHNGRKVDALSDGAWTWLRTSAFYARTYKVADMRLLVHAASNGFLLEPEWTNPHWRPTGRRITAEDLDREEYRTWRD